MFIWPTILRIKFLVAKCLNTYSFPPILLGMFSRNLSTNISDYVDIARIECHFISMPTLALADQSLLSSLCYTFYHRSDVIKLNA